MRSWRAIVLTGLTPLLLARGQGTTGSWSSFTSMSAVRAAARVGGAVGAATSGGIFLYTPGTGQYERATNADGLTGNNLTAIGYDAGGRLWVGGIDGMINVRDAQGRWSVISDIAVSAGGSSRLYRAIQRFRPAGDTLFIVSQFGVSVFRLSRWEFGDTYANFPLATQPLVEDVAVARDSVWIATNAGVLSAPLNGTNLVVPTAWAVQTTADGLPSNDVRSIAALRDTIVVGTAGGLAVRSGGTYVVNTSVSAPGGAVIPSLIVEGGTLGALSVSGASSEVVLLDGALGNARRPWPVASSPAVDVAFDADGAPWIATGSSGILGATGAGWQARVPNGPSSDLFVSLALDAGGRLWAGTGINSGGRGFMSYDPWAESDRRWRAFNVAKDTILRSDDYYKVNPSPDGSVWVSSWGAGVVKVVDTVVVRRIDAASKPSLAAAEAGPNPFVVVGSVVPDSKGRPWFVNRTATSGNVIARLDTDTTFTYFRNEYNSSEGRFASMVIDRFGTKWLGNSEASAKASSGLYYFNEGMILPGTQSTGGWGFLSMSDGLPNNTIISLAIDLDGDVWVGTDLGVVIFNEPSNPRVRRTSSFPLREQSIQALAVDPINNKWVGTKEGVFVVNVDGSQLLAQYTVTNTGGRLVSDDIRAIAIDDRHGLVYLGSEKGLSVLQIAAVRPSASPVPLAVGPNPYRLPSSDPLTIRNLVANSSVKILRVDGTLVRQFPAQGGGRAFWDGRDDHGVLVGSGTYLIIAASENGEQAAAGKVAVIRR